MCTIIELWRLGVAPEDVPRRLPHLTPAQVYDALSSYSDHQEEINGYIERNRVPDAMIDPLRYTTRVTEKRTITVDGVALTLVVERKRVKNVNARLRDTTLSISAPLKMPPATLEPIIVDLARKLVRRARAHEVNAEEDALALAQRIAARFPAPLEIAHVRFVTTQHACWGSYSSATRTIRLNAALRELPRWVLEYVVVHELAHAVHPNHSPAFWSHVRRVYPKADQAKAFLDGTSWLARRWEQLPPIERSLLMGNAGQQAEDSEA